jgi:hypothetical protein
MTGDSVRSSVVRRPHGGNRQSFVADEWPQASGGPLGVGDL